MNCGSKQSNFLKVTEKYGANDDEFEGVEDKFYFAKTSVTMNLKDIPKTNSSQMKIDFEI